MRRAAWLVAAACTADPETCDTAPGRAPPTGVHGNVLVLLLDDVGVDKVSSYALHPEAPPTPNLDALAAQGLSFDRAYAEPTCSPTRATLLTGRHPSRHGLGEWIDPHVDEHELPDEELTVPELLRSADEPWSTALIGKWHLSIFDGDRPERDPRAQGFDRFHGLLGNVDMATAGDGRPRGYSHWERVDDDVRSWDDRWITSVQVDDAVRVMAELPEPWFVEVGFSAAHVPWEDPPGRELPDGAYDTVLRDLDHHLGRLLATVDLATTTVIALADNGTPEDATRPPWDPAQAKGSLFDGGVRVPMIVAGLGVARPGSRSQALVHVADVFATVADLAGIDVDELGIPIDGLSLAPWLAGAEDGGRTCLMVERFEDDRDRHDRAIVTRDWELIRVEGEGETLHELRPSPGDQGPDRLHDGTAASESARRELRDALRRYDRTLPLR